jgi:hypothetical protein
MRLFATLLSVIFLLIACNNLSSVEKYQLITSPDGNVYRLDKMSGESWLVKGNKMEKIIENDFRLRVGQQYVGEDLYSFTYQGKGQLSEIKTLDDFWKDKRKEKSNLQH